MADVRITEARVFELLGRLYAEVQQRAHNEAALEGALGAARAEAARAAQERDDLRTRLDGAETLLAARPRRRRA